MHIRVMYNNSKYDIVTDFILDMMLSTCEIKKFYRYSEARWVTVGVDPIRTEKKHVNYTGPERRKSAYINELLKEVS
ncbi:MAG: GSU3473 family protein [Dissulfurispiraceae bacterium]